MIKVSNIILLLVIGAAFLSPTYALAQGSASTPAPTQVEPPVALAVELERGKVGKEGAKREQNRKLKGESQGDCRGDTYEEKNRGLVRLGEHGCDNTHDYGSHHG